MIDGDIVVIGYERGFDKDRRERNRVVVHRGEMGKRGVRVGA